MRARSHSGRLRLWPFPLEMASVRARSHSERFNSLRLRPCDPARILGAEVAFVRARSHSGRANSPRCRPREPARILGAGVLLVRARSHFRSAVRASPLAFWARGCRSCELARSLGARVLRGAVRASPLALWAPRWLSCEPNRILCAWILLCQQVPAVSRIPKEFLPLFYPLASRCCEIFTRIG